MVYAVIELGLSNRIKEAIDGAGFSQAEVARRLDHAPITIWRWVHGERVPSGEDVGAIAKLCGKSMEWFYAEDSAVETRGVADGPATYEATAPPRFDSELVPIEMVNLNVIGSISAGGLVESWQSDLGQVEVPAYVLRAAPKAFALRVSGNSLASDGIFDEYLVVVDPEAGFVDGKIYAVRSEENHQTIAARHVYSVGRRKFKLVSSDGSVLEVDRNKTELLGRIRWSFSFREH